MKKPTLSAGDKAALALVRKFGFVTLTERDSKQLWTTYNALADAGFLTWYLGGELGSRVFTLRPPFKERN